MLRYAFIRLGSLLAIQSKRAISFSTYGSQIRSLCVYAARQRQRSAKQLSVLDVQATAAFEASGQSYGSRRLSAALKVQGLAVGRHKARGLMRRICKFPYRNVRKNLTRQFGDC